MNAKYLTYTLLKCSGTKTPSYFGKLGFDLVMYTRQLYMPKHCCC